jgi:hypothetical protein
MLLSMSIPLTMLGLLEREPSHGYDLKRDYDIWFGRGKPLPYGQVYATLSRLARDGKAIAGSAEHGAGPGGHRPRGHGRLTHRNRVWGSTVIRLGLRLGVSSGREAVTPLVVLAVAVGIGAGLLLTAVAATNAGIVVALGLIVATFPLLWRITGPETGRSEWTR